ncbi:MAG TPA: GumC family protein [Candidatus Binatia bacterium]|nr:GumC family protein [Candidatus Binatia bacterium]
MSSQEQAVLTLAREAAEGIFRRWKLVVGVYLGIVVMAVSGIFVLPPIYQTAGKVLLTTDRAEVSTGDKTPSLVRTDEVSEGEINSQVQILKSRELIDQVLSDMNPTKDDDDEAAESDSWALRVLHAPASLLRTAYKRLHHIDNLKPGSPLYWKTRAVLERLDVSNAHPSNIIEVGYVSSDPTWAQDFVNRLMKAYVEHHAKMQQISQAQDFFNQQSELLRQKLANSESELRKARERAGTLAGQQNEVHERLNEFNAELSRARIARVEQEKRMAFLEQTLAGKGGRVATPELIELEAKRADLIGKYKPDSERVKEIDSQIERLRKAIAGYATFTGGPASDGTGGTAAGTDLVAGRAALAALQGREAALSKAAEDYKKQADFLDSQNFDLARLERQVKLDEETYSSYVRSAEQSRLTNAVEQSKLLRLQIIEEAPLPLEAIAPKKGRILFFALFGGLVMATGLGLARDHLDSTIKSSADVRRYANLETLLALPDKS